MNLYSKSLTWGLLAVFALTFSLLACTAPIGSSDDYVAKQVVANPPHRQFQADGNIFAYLEEMPYRIERTGHVVIIPACFVTDFASVPQLAQSVLPQLGPHSMAAVLHDFLYWDQSCTREQADLLFYEAMTEYGVTRWRRSIAYWAVYWRGQAAWDSNASERKNGLPRIIPAKYLEIPPNERWADYRKHLTQEGVTAEPFPDPPAPQPSYCTLDENAVTSDVGRPIDPRP
jgi:hypothetical protein